MKIVILDGYTLNPGDLTWDGFKNIGNTVVYDRTPQELVKERIKGFDAVLTNKTELTSDIINSSSDLKYIGVFATGYNVVDVEAAKKRDIPVCNVPTYGTNTVAQFVFAHLLNICHHVQDHCNSVKNGDWSNCSDFCYWNFPLTELAGKTMGIIGYGRIGQATGRIAQAFRMNVLAFDEYKNPELESDTMKYVSFDELIKSSDVISLHCPLFESTEGIICAENISKMKDNVIIINTSRGPLINEKDLYNALESGKVRAAGLDVVSTEPIKEDNILLKAKNCFITPHIAWAPIEARQRLLDIAVGNLASFVDGKTINSVN